jgi:general secretion pathway protein D
VGQLFRYTSQDSAKRNLMVFIHTTVLRDDDNYSAASKENMTRSRRVSSSVWKSTSWAS